MKGGQPRLDPGKSAPWFDVPAGTRSSECRSCRRTVYWIRREDTGRMHPVDCNVVGGVEPTSSAPGMGVSHFATCPQREQWRKDS